MRWIKGQNRDRNPGELLQADSWTSASVVSGEELIEALRRQVWRRRSRHYEVAIGTVFFPALFVLLNLAGLGFWDSFVIVALLAVPGALRTALWLPDGIRRAERQIVLMVSEFQDPRHVGVLLDAYAYRYRWKGELCMCLEEALARLLPQLSTEEAGDLEEHHLAELRSLVCPAGEDRPPRTSTRLRITALETLERARDAQALPFIWRATHPETAPELREAAIRFLPDFEAYAAASRVSGTLLRPSDRPGSLELLRASAEVDARTEQLLRAVNSARLDDGGGYTRN